MEKPETPVATPPFPQLADAAWAAAPYPAVVVAADGRPDGMNDAAALLFSPTGGLPKWLSEADPAGQAVSGPVGGRGYTAHPVRLTEDRVCWWLAEDTDVRLVREELNVERERAAFLSEASNALLSSLNLKRCMAVTAELTARHLADAAMVIAPAVNRRHPVVRCVRDGKPEHTELALMNPEAVPGLSEALQGFPPVPSRWIDPRSAPDWLLPEGFGEVGSIVVTPLPGQGVPAGALILLRRREHQGFSDSEEVFARLFASRAGAAMSAARLFAEQTSITETLMRELLPPKLQQVAGVEFAGGYRASQDHERIGGDFYDVHPVAGGEGSLAILGDVCGKGLEAAVLTGKVRNTLHALLPLANDHQRMLTLLNGALLNTHDTRFVTLVLASVVRDGAGVRLRVTSAGHPPPLVVRVTGQVEEVPTMGTVIGVLPEIESVTAEVKLAPGESCLLFTDGITEAKGGPLGQSMFGEERLHRVLSECAGMPAEAVAERVRMLAAEWAGRNPHDDMAVLVIAAPRGQHLTAVGGQGRGRYTA